MLHCGTAVMADEEQARKEQALSAYRAKLLQHKARAQPGPGAAETTLGGTPPGHAVCRLRASALSELPLTCTITPQELDAKVRALREEVKKTRKAFEKSEDDLKALQSVGQIIGEVLRQLDADRCAWPVAAPRSRPARRRTDTTSSALQLLSRPAPALATWSAAAPSWTRPS